MRDDIDAYGDITMDGNVSCGYALVSHATNPEPEHC